MNRIDRLHQLFEQVNDVIVKRQNPVTGLLPASTSVNTHGDYTDAWVRDNVYSILSVWALGLAYRKSGETERSDQLEQTTIKLMRGLLLSMMRQSNKVEAFKHSLHPLDALHAKYDTSTGLPVVADDAWGHLQIDATSLYLLMLAQMSASGLRIIRTFDEVDFIQNLLFYIGSAYRTPDFGIWERGNKINNGKTEINASSVGMAKAALQALDGFNLFGKNASKRAVVHSVADSISLARNTLSSLLPRESLSKEVDSALLSIIGYPAFAVGDIALVKKTRDEILTKLGGDYGCKRFLWDGHQTAIEESSRMYYEHSELVTFEHIESEWPLFFTYLYIQALFDDNAEEAQKYRKKIESLMVESNNYGLIPELYYLPKENIAAEKEKPRTQKRVPNENVPLVWAQSLYLTGLLFDEGYIDANDLDPCNMRRRSRRFTKTQIALVVLAENDVVKEQLAQRGIIAESLCDIKPLNVVAAPDLAITYSHVGANQGLGLSGRPQRRLQSLATSQAYEVDNKNCLCLSWLQSEKIAYRSYDAELSVRYIERELKHINTHWLNNEAAVFTWMVDQDFFSTPQIELFLTALKHLQLHKTFDFVGYASASLAFRASSVNRLTTPDLTIDTYESRIDSEGSKSSVDILNDEAKAIINSLSSTNDADIYIALKAFISDKNLDHTVDDGAPGVSLRDFLTQVYFKARIINLWKVTRYCFALLEFVDSEIGDALTLLSACHLSVRLGHNTETSVIFNNSSNNDHIISEIRRVCANPLEQTLTQEIMGYVGYLMRTDPDLFLGIRSIQINNLLFLCQSNVRDPSDPVLLEHLALLAPSQLLERLEAIFTSQKRFFSTGITANYTNESSKEPHNVIRAMDTDWFQWRITRGLITRLSDEFLEQIWRSLDQATIIAFGDQGNTEGVLDCAQARSSMTPGEANFARLLDKLTQNIHPPYYKSAVMEALYAFTQLCTEQAESKFEQAINLHQILDCAAHKYKAEMGIESLVERDLDLLLEQPPQRLQYYVKEVLKERIV